MELEVVQMINKLTDEQVDALLQWAHRNGRTWKSSLRDAWMTGDYGGFEDANFLQQVRNNLGPAWLVRYRLPKFLTVAR